MRMTSIRIDITPELKKRIYRWAILNDCLDINQRGGATITRAVTLLLQAAVDREESLEGRVRHE